MPPCKSKVRVGWNKQASLEACFFIDCVKGKGHEGEHLGQVWVWGENEATKELGVYKPIMWK